MFRRLHKVQLVNKRKSVKITVAYSRGKDTFRTIQHHMKYRKIIIDVSTAHFQLATAQSCSKTDKQLIESKFKLVFH